MCIYVVVYLRIPMYAAYAELQNVIVRVRFTGTAHAWTENLHVESEFASTPQCVYACN